MDICRKQAIISSYEKIVILSKELFDLWKILDKPLLYRKILHLFGSTDTKNIPFKQLDIKNNPIYHYTF